MKLKDFLKAKLPDRRIEGEDDHFSLTCQYCLITPESIQEVVFGYLNEFGFILCDDEKCPIAGIDVQAPSGKKWSVQATIFHSGYATISVIPI